MRPATRRHAATGREADDGGSAKPQPIGDRNRHRHLGFAHVRMERGTVRVQQYIGAVAERQKRGPIGVRGTIKHRAPLASVAREEGQAAACGFARLGRPRQPSPRLGALGSLREIHLGAKPRHERAGVFGERVRHLHHPNTRKQSSHPNPQNSEWAVCRNDGGGGKCPDGGDAPFGV